MKYFKTLPLAAALAQAVTDPTTLDTADADSIKSVAGTLAYDAMTYYKGNTSSNPIDVGDLQDPYYWWVAGALWGAMLDYYHYTGDSTYNDVVTEALLHDTNLGENKDYMPTQHAFEEGNDDLFFWGSAVLTAAENKFPQDDSSLPSWIDLGANVFNSLVSRWDTSACNGGLRWQIYPDNPNGIDYKNSISNGGMFQLAARLARATGNSTYQDWAEKIWDWSWDVGFIDHDYWHVYDGASSSQHCDTVNKVSFTYTNGIYLYGAAVMANFTESDDWKYRATNLLQGAGWFFSPYSNSTNVLYEAACEKENACNADMSTQKGYLSRFMWKSAVMVSDLKDKVEEYMLASSKAAVQTCTGGDSGTQCGQRWWVKGYDSNPGLGQQMCALETVHGILAKHAPAPHAAEGFGGDHGQTQEKPTSTTTAPAIPTSTSQAIIPTSTSTSTSTTKPKPTSTTANAKPTTTGLSKPKHDDDNGVLPEFWARIGRFLCELVSAMSAKC